MPRGSEVFHDSADGFSLFASLLYAGERNDWYWDSPVNIHWDPKTESIVGDDEANAFLSRPQREGYEIYG